MDMAIMVIITAREKLRQMLKPLLTLIMVTMATMDWPMDTTDTATSDMDTMVSIMAREKLRLLLSLIMVMDTHMVMAMAMVTMVMVMAMAMAIMAMDIMDTMDTDIMAI